jgi:hypothetical protein
MNLFSSAGLSGCFAAEDEMTQEDLVTGANDIKPFFVITNTLE